MPRVGYNPMTWTMDVHTSRPITVALIVHIPFLDGYWKHSLDVLKVSLGSLATNTRPSFDVMVFDNGSCAEASEYLLELRRVGAIQFLFLSEHNIGKSGAWNMILSAAPGEVVAYSDSDVLFLPGWLEASLEILEAFPKAGMITAQPARRRSNFHSINSSTLTQAKQDDSIRIDKGNLLPQDYLRAHRHGLGETRDAYQKRVGSQLDVQLSKGPHSAIVSATHFQFVTTKSVLERILPLEVLRPMRDVQQLDKRINDKGYWRLSTCEYLVHHMGNKVPSGARELSWLGGADLTSYADARVSPEPNAALSNSVLRYFLGRSRVKKLIRNLNTLSFRVLAQFK